MNKKLICTLMAGALLVGTVTGCGSSSEGESSAKGTELELFSSKAENKDILQKLVDKFNETHKDVTIKITAPADAGTVLKTRMAKNDMPDIVAMGGDNNYTEVESAGMLVDLSSEDYVSNIQESYLQMVYDVNKDKEEKVYGVPYATNASGVIYNVDKFKEHGIEIPKTWDEFIDVLEKLQDAGEQPLLMTYKDAWTSNCPWNSIASDLAPESFNDDRKAGKTTFVGTHEEIAEKYKENMAIKTPSLNQLVKNLSGGNQQKVILGRWMAADSELIIFDEPTRGIDVGAKYEIYKLMNDLVENQGKTILMISSEMEELMGMSDRIVVLSEGNMTGELSKEEFTQEVIMTYASAARDK